MPAAVVVTTRDTVVSPRKQRILAAALGAQVIEVPIDHLEVTKPEFAHPLLEALAAVAPGESVRASAGMA
jgi:hypothetical protein